MTTRTGTASATPLPAAASPAIPGATRATLRREARARRRALSPAERRTTALAIAAHLAATGWLRPQLRLAGYLATPEEIDVSACLGIALRRGAEIWLPRLDTAQIGRMHFAPADGPMRRNIYGIAEPTDPRRLSARWLQLVLVPLVAVDDAGMRLGMGGGFYDRALAWRRLRRHWAGPRLVGIAHSSQRIPRLESLPHDIPLDALLTERGLIHFRQDSR
ncbi:MAG: 5-formyltetrahydrofolate cyclo-ligase [Steroidobacteraceae bacterium]|nr:5-formyltetrahydrofolate cyclo-ligase [Nevskiaceae bacterium]MCP5360561.1 5-formyltetrahydrofolate cyclo-ligase [Nevskiaceae bacterium]MCP5472908.1 5-formyltetrahydrofolate cyclo-ligase [Nevskiaceae bacterium]